jgi:predicted RNA-binding protein YlqC (UPF0109 family)
VRDLILFMAEQLTGTREGLDLRESKPGHFQLLVEPKLMGRLIGREGRTIKALRTLLEASAAAKGEEVRLDVDEQR